MKPVSIMHIADMHLGSTISSFDSSKNILRGRELELTCMTALKKAADYDIVLFPGDVFDTVSVSERIADMFLEAVASSPGTRFFYSCGNHDPYVSPVVEYCVKNCPPNLHIFAPEFVECVTLDDLGVRVYGRSFVQNSPDLPLLLQSEECSEEYINIMCVHGETNDPSSPYNPVSVDELSRLGFDYVALGHVHNFSGIQAKGKTRYAYSGVVEPRGFDECGKKGYICGTISKNECNLEFCPASRREYHDISVDITNCTSLTSVIDVVSSIISSYDNIYRITLNGQNRICSVLNSGVIEDSVNAFFVKIVDNTRPECDIEAYSNDYSLKGHCARETLSLIDSDKDNKELYANACSLLFDLFDKRGDANDY